eukprot:s4237_g2.t1
MLWGLGFETMESKSRGFKPQEKISTESAARYILRTLNIDEETAKVLFLPCSPFDNFPSYLTASVFHGLVSLLGDRVVDVPEYVYAYQYDSGGDFEGDMKLRANIWGQGFTLGFKLPQRPFLDRSNISARIWRREFDLIVFGRMSAYEPCNFYAPFGDRPQAVPEFYEDVSRSYPKERVALLYGDDSGIDDPVMRTQLYRMAPMNTGLGMVFLREMLPFVSEGSDGETLRPVDGRVLQPGCFYEEWLEFFRLWRSPSCREAGSCLVDCVTMGHCEAVTELMRSSSFELLPPHDSAVAQQFCRSGFLLKAAVLVQYYQPDVCLDDLHCKIFCQTSLDYTRQLKAVPAEPFFREMGITPQHVLLLLSQGCAGGLLALQPAAQAKDVLLLTDEPWREARNEWQARLLLAQGYLLHVVSPSQPEEIPARLQLAAEQQLLRLHRWEGCADLQGFGRSGTVLAQFDGAGLPSLHCLLQGFEPQYVTLQSSTWHAVALLIAAGFCQFKVAKLFARSLGGLFGDLASDASLGLRWRNVSELLRMDLADEALHAKRCGEKLGPLGLVKPMNQRNSVMVQDGRPRAESDSDHDRSDAEDEDKAYVTVSRAELMRGHRPVVVSEVPVYVALEDRDGRRFEDKGSCQYVKYRWMRGPVIEPCFFHPHKMSQIKDVAKTYNHYCSRECFLRGWHHLGQHQWGKKPENDGYEDGDGLAAGYSWLHDMLGEWTQVASTRQYCPSQNDINRPLRMEIIPLTKDGRECVNGMMTITTGTVIPTPKEARMRQMISNGGQFNAEWLSKQPWIQR